MTSLVWARPDALWLLALVPLFALTGIWLGTRRGRLSRVALLWRLAVVTLLTLGLAEPMIASGSATGGVVFVVDHSDSIGAEARDAADRWLRDALSAAPATQRAAIVAFGAKPVLARAPGTARDLLGDDAAAAASSNGAAVDPAFTGIDAGLGLARALPLGGGRRIVLVSDGAENVGRAIDQASQAALENETIDVLALPGVNDSDLRVDGISAPTSAWEGEPITVLAGVETGRDGPAKVDLLVDGQVKTTEEVDLRQGLSSRAFTLDDLAPGFHSLEVRVQGDSEVDRRPDDDLVPHGIVVRDRPRILLIVPEGADSGIMRGILERGGTEVTVMEPAGIPSRLSELGAWDGFVLDNVPAASLTVDQVAGLREATRSLGRGLVVIGGTSAYGPGGYAGTPLEDALPVTVKVTDGRERQRVALLLIMDKSGSMGYDPLGGKGKIEMAKEAVRLAARSLTEGDQIGLIVFNDRQEWIVPLTTIGDESTRAAIDRKIAAIEPDGGTEILPALSVGLDAIRNADADARHIVLLSDGKARTGTRESYQRLLDDALADRTTLSTIAIGEDADTDLLNFLADEGGGRYHFTVRDEDIPRLTLEEAQRRQPVRHSGHFPTDPDGSQPDTGWDRSGEPARPGGLRLCRGEARRAGDPDLRPRGSRTCQMAIWARACHRLDGGQRVRSGRAMGNVGWVRRFLGRRCALGAPRPGAASFDCLHSPRWRGHGADCHRGGRERGFRRLPAHLCHRYLVLGRTGRDPGTDADGTRRIHAASASSGPRRLRR